MKKVFLAALAVCTVFASCSKDENEVDGVLGESATLKIDIAAPQNVRAADTSLPTDAVSNYNVFVTDGTGEIKWSAYSNTSGGMNGMDVSTAAKNVYVVANAGDITTSISTMAGLNSYIADLNATGSQKSARWATGSTTSDLVFSMVNDVRTASTTVHLKFIAARITVNIVNNMTNYTGGGITASPAEVELKSIAVLNARGESKLFGTSLIPASYTPGKMYYEGLSNSNYAYFPVAANYTDVSTTGLLNDPFASPAPAGDFPNTYYYYVFENNSVTTAAFPTIITLVGKDETGAAAYWPVHLSMDEVFTVGSLTSAGVTRGNSYDITITLTGDATDGGGGTDDPTIPVVAKLNVCLELTNWNPVILGKTFE